MPRLATTLVVLFVLPTAIPVAVGQQPVPLSKLLFHDLAFSPDSKQLAGLGKEWGNSHGDGLYVWSTNTQELRLIAAPPRDEKLIGMTAFSPDGKSLATADYDGAIRFWETSDWTEAAPIQLPSFKNVGGHETQRRAHHIAFSADGTSLATTSRTKTEYELQIWDVETKERRVDRLMHGAVNRLAFSPDGRRLVLGLARGPEKGAEVQVWNVVDLELPKSKPARTLQGNPGYCAIAVSADSRLIAAAYREQVQLHDLHSGKSMYLGVHGGGVLCLAFSPDGRYLATGAKNHPDQVGPETLKLWDLRSGQIRPLPDQPSGWGTVSLAFSPDGKYLATSVHRPNDEPGRLFLWDLAKLDAPSSAADR